MKYLNAHKYLSQLEVINETIRQDLERLNEMMIQSTSTGAIRYDKDNVQTSPVGDKLCLEVIRYTDFNDYVNQEIDRYVNAKNKIIKQIRALRNADYIRILYEVYVNGKNLKVVAAEMQRSYKWVREMYKKALKVFEETHENLTYIY